MEGATPASYHAAPTILKQLDDVFDVFLEHVGISMQAALVDYNLAPLCTRRDLAMLALLHKVSLGLAPKPIGNMFKLRAGTLDCHGFSLGLPTHCRQLHDPVAFNHPPIIKRSV